MAADLSLLARDERTAEARAPAQSVPPPRRRWATRVVIPGVVFGATALLLGVAARDVLWPAVGVHVAPVVARAGVAGSAPAGGHTVVAQAPGWVEADPYAVTVSALADGIVREVLVLEGEAVAAEQVVARLVDTDARLALARAAADVQERTAMLATAQAARDAAQREWDNPVALTRAVAAAEAALAEQQAELQRWPAELAAEEAQATELEAELRRLEPLHTSGQTSQIEYIRAQQQYAAQRAKADAARARRPVLEAQQRGMEAELVAARENLRLRITDTRTLAEAGAAVDSAAAKLTSAQAMRDEALLRLERMDVRSPVAGIVMSRLVEPGTKLMLNANEMRSATVVRLYDPQHLQVRVDVPLADAAKVGVGQPVEVIVDVLPDKTFAGHVTRVVNEADVQKNTLQVKVAIHDPTPELKPEMLARARFFGAARAVTAAATAETSPAQRVFIPAALLGQGPGHHVWLADQVAGVAVLRVVTPGTARQDDWLEIADGLHPGDWLIVDPPPGLRDGLRIRILGERAATAAEGAGHGAH
jgi:HlyD family secretion protein